MDKVKFAEQYFGIKLLPYQKIILQKFATERDAYVCFPYKCGYSEILRYKEMAKDE